MREVRLMPQSYAGINLLFNFGMAFATRIPVLKSEKAGYFFSPVNCFIGQLERLSAKRNIR